MCTLWYGLISVLVLVTLVSALQSPIIYIYILLQSFLLKINLCVYQVFHVLFPSAVWHLTDGTWPISDQLQQCHSHPLLHLPFSVWLPLWFHRPEVKLLFITYFMSKYISRCLYRILQAYCQISKHYLLLSVLASANSGYFVPPGPQRTAPGPPVPPAPTMKTSPWFRLWRPPTLHWLERTSSSTWCLILKKWGQGESWHGCSFVV